MSDKDFFNSSGTANSVPAPAPPPRQRSSAASRRSKPPPPPPPRGSRSGVAASSTAPTAAPPPAASSGTGGGAVPTFYGRTHPVDKGARISADVSGGPAAAAPSAPAPAPAAPSQSDLDWFGSSSAAAAAPAPSAASAPPAAMNPYAGYGAQTQPAAQQQQQPQPQFQHQPQPGAYAGYETAPLVGQPSSQQPAGAGTGGFSGTIMSGPMGGAAPAASASGPSYAGSVSHADSDYENEPPLMEELGINLEHIGTKSRSVIWPIGKYTSAHIDASIMEDADLVGPLAFALLLGGELLLSGKIHFGYIYGFGLFGTLAMGLVLNLMSPVDAISVWTVISVLGYALLPVNALAGINVLYRVQKMGALGVFLGVLTIAWCTVASTRLFERGCGLRDQRYLVAYPGMLLYSAFVMITIF